MTRNTLKLVDIIQKDKKETLSDKLFDLCPGWLYRFYTNYISINTNIRRLHFFYQRCTRGFDDSETWSLDITFFKWLAPRLKRFSELTCGWPDSKEYPTFEAWKKDLDNRVNQCYKIINVDEFEFKDHSCLTKETKALIKKNKITSKSTINAFAKDDYIKDFMQWYAKHLKTLWW